MCKITDGLKEDFQKLGEIVNNISKENQNLKSQNDLITITIESINDYISVKDINTQQILFINKEGKKILNQLPKENDKELLSKFKSSDKIEKEYRRTYYNPELKKLFYIIGDIKNIEGKTLKFERAIDITSSIKEIQEMLNI